VVVWVDFREYFLTEAQRIMNLLALVVPAAHVIRKVGDVIQTHASPYIILAILIVSYTKTV